MNKAITNQLYFLYQFLAERGYHSFDIAKSPDHEPLSHPIPCNAVIFISLLGASPLSCHKAIPVPCFGMEIFHRC